MKCHYCNRAEQTAGRKSCDGCGAPIKAYEHTALFAGELVHFDPRLGYGPALAYAMQAIPSEIERKRAEAQSRYDQNMTQQRFHALLGW